jgi:hypothetical protein
VPNPEDEANAAITDYDMKVPMIQIATSPSIRVLQPGWMPRNDLALAAAVWRCHWQLLHLDPWMVQT